MKGFITYAPLFKYLQVHGISHEKFMEDLGFDTPMIELLLSNGSVASDILEKICSTYGLSLSMVATMDYELPIYDKIIDFSGQSKKPSVKSVLKNLGKYISREKFEVNSLCLMNAKTNYSLMNIDFEPQIEAGEEKYFEARERGDFIFTPETLQKFMAKIIKKNPHFIDGLEKVTCVDILLIRTPVERNPRINRTNVVYDEWVLIIDCDMSKLEAEMEAETTTYPPEEPSQKKSTRKKKEVSNID